MMGGEGQGYGMWGMGWGGGIMMIVFWIVIIVGVVLLIRNFAVGKGGASTPVGQRDPLEVLKERYARGEIGTQEYEERKKTLTQS